MATGGGAEPIDPPGAEQLRLAGEDDIPRLIEIRAAVGENRLSDPASITPAHYLAYIGAGHCLVWEESGRVLGFAALDAARATLWALFVDPSAAGRGIGRALLGAVLYQARTVGLSELHLATAPGTRAERLYAAMGWTLTGRDGSGDLLMTRSL